MKSQLTLRYFYFGPLLLLCCTSLVAMDNKLDNYAAGFITALFEKTKKLLKLEAKKTSEKSQDEHFPNGSVEQFLLGVVYDAPSQSMLSDEHLRMLLNLITEGDCPLLEDVKKCAQKVTTLNLLNIQDTNTLLIAKLSTVFTNVNRLLIKIRSTSEEGFFDASLLENITNAYPNLMHLSVQEIRPLGSYCALEQASAAKEFLNAWKNANPGREGDFLITYRNNNI